MRNLSLTIVLVAAACGKSGGGNTYKHANPGFKVDVPGDIDIKGHEKNDNEGGGDIDLVNPSDSSRDLLLVWGKSGSSYDPAAAWDRHHHHDDAVKILAEGDLPGGGKFIQIDRGKVTFSHALLVTGGYAIECTTSSPNDKLDQKLLDACKTLSSN